MQSITSFPRGVGAYGMPTFPAPPLVPLGGSTTGGSIWWVDGTNGATTNTGTYPTDAFLTISAALSACTASGNDIIYVMPGTYTLTSALTFSKARVSIIGVGGGRKGFQGVNLTASSVGGAMVNVAANNITFQGITFTGEATRACVDCSVASSFATFIDCEFIVPDSATATAIASTAAWTESSWINCTFKGLGTITTLVGPNGDNNLFENCVFLATGSSKTITTGLLAGATTIGLLLKDCTFMERGGTVFTLGVDFSAGTYNFARGCFFNMGTAANSMTITGTGNGALGCNVASGTI